MIEIRVDTIAGRRASSRVVCSSCGNVSIPTLTDLRRGYLNGRGWHSTRNRSTALAVAHAHGTRYHAGEFEIV